MIVTFKVRLITKETQGISQEMRTNKENQMRCLVCNKEFKERTDSQELSGESLLCDECWNIQMINELMRSWDNTLALRELERDGNK